MDSQPPKTAKKRTEVYLEIATPSKFYEVHKDHSNRTPVSRKENRIPESNMSNATSECSRDSRKRKLSDASTLHNDVKETHKKRKGVLELSAPPKQDKSDTSTSEEFFYCHQCSKKRDSSLEIVCTWLGKSLCRAKYCKACLKNRYGQDMIAIKSAGLPDRKHSEGHTRTLGYVWKCPKCLQTCNCKSCRKKLGLGPTGNLLFAARKKGLDSAAQMLEEDPSIQGVMKGQRLPEEERSHWRSRKIPKIVVTTASNGDVEGVITSGEERPKKKRRPAFDKTKEPPEPEWEPIDSSLQREEIEERMALREFAIRFSSLLELKFNVLEDMDEFDHFNDSACLALVRGMLEILARQTQDRAIVPACKSLRSSGPVPTKIWLILEQARASADSFSLLSDLPNPSEAVATAYNTRTGQSLTQAAQFLPILKYLMEKTMMTEIVHDAIEEGANEGKHIHREMVRKVKEEREKWSEQKRTFMDEKAANESNTAWDTDGWKIKMKAEEKIHKELIASIEFGDVQTAPLYTPRFRHIGVDLDQRVYYILSPLNSKRRIREEDRAKFKKWSTFVAVWGRPGSILKAPSSPKEDDYDSDEEAEEEPEEQWWGFYDTKDIRKLARWLQWKGDLRDATEGPVGYVKKKQEGNKGEDSHDSDIDGLEARSQTVSRAPSPLSDLSNISDEEEERAPLATGDISKLELGGPTSSADMKSLVKRLHDFSDWLDWRMAKPEEAKA